MRYGDGGEVVRDIQLELAAGSFHFLMGPSGAGKSSLLRVLALAEPTSRGRLHLFGRDVARLERAEIGALQRRIGMVFQDFRLLDHLTRIRQCGLATAPRRRCGRRRSPSMSASC